MPDNKIDDAIDKVRMETAFVVAGDIQDWQNLKVGALKKCFVKTSFNFLGLNMKFSFDGSKVVCSRIERTDDGDVLRNVVEFDAHVDVVPAHVAARLTESERQELKRFLEDKERIQSKPEHWVILEALPALVDKVRGVLVSIEQIDEHVFQQLKSANERLSAALNEVAVKAQDSNAQLTEISESEALKPRLDIIKDGL